MFFARSEFVRATTSESNHCLKARLLVFFSPLPIARVHGVGMADRKQPHFLLSVAAMSNISAPAIKQDISSLKQDKQARVRKVSPKPERRDTGRLVGRLVGWLVGWSVDRWVG